MVELTDQELMQCSNEDVTFYHKCTSGLPTMAGFNGDYKDKYGIPIPYGSSPHIAQHFRTTIEIVKPKRILEIGTNCGWGASLWLESCAASLVSIDISDKEETIEAGRILEERYPGRFRFYLRKDLPILKDYFDLVFIDGGHEEPDVTADIQLAKDLNIPYLLFDDFYSRFGPGTKPAIAKFPELELVKDMNNLRLYKWQKL